MAKCGDCQYIIRGEGYDCCTLTRLCVDADKEHDCGCFNRDLTEYDICYNCRYYGGGGDWGLFCSHKDMYYHLGKFNDDPCEHYERRNGKMANEWKSDLPRRDDSAAKYVVRGDELIKLVPIIGIPNVYDTEVVMTADAFRECYKKWIKEENE